jgi:hypothetical protein
MSETGKTCATGAISEVETFDPSRFYRKSRYSHANDEIHFTMNRGSITNMFRSFDQQAIS